ncbi:MAG: peptidoglycan-associated lipoprotein Pal [Terriglobales bacterium]|jgi:peptidoglycan-associated lipoprotein
MRRTTTARWATLVFALGIIVFLSACHPKPATPLPTPPSTTAPTASLSANPNTLNQGQSTTLTWQTTNATDVSIDGIGPVATSGSRQVIPAESTTYHLIAKGAGGTQDATARVTVNSATAPPLAPAANLTEEELFAQNVRDIYFDYDKADVRADQQGSLQGDARFLQAHPNIHITVEGHCDERGSTEFNLALGTNRADTVKNALIQAGVSGARIKTFTYGKEKPFCTESNESCWQQNRRGHFVYEK